MSKISLHKDDKVIVLYGKDRGKKGKILSVNRKDGTLIVEGVNIAAKHTKPRKAGEAGGIIKQEIPIAACKVMNICSKCGEPSRSGRRKLTDGTSVRYCKKCGVEN